MVIIRVKQDKEMGLRIIKFKSKSGPQITQISQIRKGWVHTRFVLLIL